MSGSYLSREPYGGVVSPGPQRGPDPGSAGIAARTLAAGMAEVSGQWARFWGAAENAQAVAEAGKLAADASMQLTDMVRGFEQDPDPAGVPARFQERVAQWRDEMKRDKPEAVASYLDRALNSLIPAAYGQVNRTAAQRLRTNIQAGLSDTLGTHAQALAAAPDEPTLLAQVQGMKALVAGSVAGGTIDQSQAGRLLSNALRQSITLRAAAGDPGAATAAAALLDRFRGEMDAADVTALATGLRAPLERDRAEGAAQAAFALPQLQQDRARAVVDGLIARGLPPTVAIGLAANAIAESGANPATPAGDGGRSDGLFQWNGPRREAFRARFGRDPSQATLDQQLDFAVDELRTTEARAGGAILAATTPEEAARLASTLYLRPANTAAEERRRSALATRLAGGRAPAADRAEALADVRQRLAGEPLHVRLQGEALVARMFADRDGALAQDRAALGTELRDLEAAYMSGRTGFEVPEARIRALLDGPDAERTINQLNLVRGTGAAVAAAAFASPEEVAALRQRMQPPDPDDPALAGQYAEAAARFDRALAARNKAIRDDPAGYAMQAPEVARLAEAGRPAQEISAASLAVQRRLGLPEAQLRVLPTARVEQIAELLRTTPPGKADMGVTLARVQQDLGPALWDRAFGELVQHGRIGWEWQAIAAMTHPEQAAGRADLQAALVLMEQKGGPEALRKLVNPDTMKGFAVRVDEVLAPFREATRLHPGGAALFDTMRRAVDTLATWHAFRGASAANAAERAYRDVIGARWDTAGDDGSGVFSTTPTMLVPKGQAGPIEAALALVRSSVQSADLQPIAALPAAELEALARRGVWINNADASGAVLMGRARNGALIDLRHADGSAIEVLFNALPVARLPSQGNPDGQPGQPVRRFPGLAPMVPR